MPKRIEKDQILLTTPADQLKFCYLRGKGHLVPYMWNRFQWYNYPRWRKVAKFPPHVDAEISSACDMECPMCYTRTNIFKSSVKRTLMDFGLFRKIVDEAAGHKLFSLRLSLRGEAFLNPELVRMLKYAKDGGIKEVSSLTNALKLNEDTFEKLVDNGLDWLTISIDGWGQMYESIRRPAKFHEMYQKIKNFSRIKKDKKSRKPVLKVQSVWPAIQEDPGYFYNLFKPYVDEVAANPLIDYLRKDRDIAYIDDFTCPYLWQRISIGADGNILMCQCDDMEEDLLGNARDDSIYDVWHGKKLNGIRRLHIEHEGHIKLKPCRQCAYPRKMELKEKTLLNNREIKVEKYAGRSETIGGGL